MIPIASQFVTHQYGQPYKIKSKLGKQSGYNLVKLRLSDHQTNAWSRLCVHDVQLFFCLIFGTLG